MHILYLGNVTMGTSADGSSSSRISPAGQGYQASLLRELKRAGCRITIVGTSPHPTYPEGPLLVRGTRSDGEQIAQYRPSYLNVRFLSVLSGMLSVVLTGLRAARRDGKADVVMFYNPDLQYGLGAILIAALARISSVGILADYNPPEDWTRIKQTVKNRWLDTTRRWIMRRLDGAVALSSAFRELTSGPMLIVEGGVSVEGQSAESSDAEPTNAEDKAIIAYTGRLDRRRGIGLLMDAVELMEHSAIELRITGHGPLADEVEDRDQNSDRIQFLGFVSKAEYQRLLAQATVCVVPQRTSYAFSRYCFPSKLLEYLAMGKPVVTTDVGDVRTLYGDHVIVLDRDQETPKGLAQLLDEVLATDPAELERQAHTAQAYVLREKRWERQAQRILEFLETDRDQPSGDRAQNTRESCEHSV